MNAFFSFGLKAEPSPSQEMLSVPANQIGRVYAEGGDIPHEAAEYLETIRSAQEWATSYNPVVADPEKQGLELDAQFIESWISVVSANPKICLDAYIAMMHPFWELTESYDSMTDYLRHSFVLDFGNYDSFTLESGAKLDAAYLDQFIGDNDGVEYPGMRALAPRTIDYLISSDYPILSDIARLLWFNRGLPFSVLLVGLMVAARKRRVADWLFISLPVSCVLLSLLLFAPVAHLRYAMEMYYALPLLIAWCMAIPARGSRVLDHDAQQEPHCRKASRCAR